MGIKNTKEASLLPGFITVRTTSTRLPEKCLLPFGDCTVIGHIIRRARHFNIDPIVCTSTDSSDDILEKIAILEKAKCFRGSLVNKLKRWADCAMHFDLKAFHTVDADDPFFDGLEMWESYKLGIKEDWDVVSPTEKSAGGGASVGYTLKTDVIQRICARMPEETDTEMIWYHLKKLPGIKQITLSGKNSQTTKMRLTLDYEEDYWLLESVRRIVGNLASRTTIQDLFRRNPDLYLINWFRNEEWKAGQLDKQI